MKIAIICNGYPPLAPSMGFVHARVKQYLDIGHEVVVFIRPSPRSEKTIYYEKVKVVQKKINGAIKEINSFAPDVVAVHAPHRWSMTVADNLNFPKVSWIHGHEALYLSSYYIDAYPLKKILFTVYDIQKFYKLRKFLNKCYAVIYVSRWMKEKAEDTLKMTHPNSFVIPNSINNDLFNPNLKQSRNTKLKGVSVRNLTSHKYGLDMAIKAYAGLELTDLTIVGTGPFEKEYRELVKRVNANVNIRAERIDHDKMPHLLKNYDYFVAPSRLEAQGVAMCEAMAMGLPVVATGVGGIPEFVTHGKDGYLVPAEDPLALRGAIINLIKNPEFENFSRNAIEKIRNLCSSENTIQKELEIMSAISGKT